MLDRTIPYFNVLMKRPAGTALVDVGAPGGYTIQPFESGEKDWARIEVSVGEFASEKEALDRFAFDYAKAPDELPRRIFFAVTPENEKIGTVASWWCKTGDRRDASLYWLGVKPDHQGEGIGKALTYQCLKCFMELEGDVDVYLHTQPWSYRAIGIYLKAGFRFLETEDYADYRNQNKEAMPVLKKWMGNRICWPQG